MQSENILEMDGREGSFLVRPSTTKDMYTLSVFTRSGGLVSTRSLYAVYYVGINKEIFKVV